MDDERSMIVVGIGNPDRGDDGAGREAARRLRASLESELKILELDGEPAALLARLKGARVAYLIDACASGAPAGEVRRLDVSETPLPSARFGLSSHGLGLAEALELARALGQLPPRCVVFAIEGENFSAGAKLSAPVQRAIDAVVKRLRAEIQDGALHRLGLHDESDASSSYSSLGLRIDPRT
jgi:hydrogenase maturation protease